MILCNYDGVLRGDEEDHLYIGGERRVVLLDDDNVTYDFFKSQIRCICRSGSSPIKMMCS